MSRMLERYYLAAMRKEPDQVPVVIYCSEPTYAAFCGERLIDLYRDVRKMLECQLRFIRRFPNALHGHFTLWPRLSGPGDGFTTAFGAELVWTEDSSPVTKPLIRDPKEVDSLKVPDPHKDGRLPLQLEALRYYVENAPLEVRERYGLLDHYCYCPGGVEYAALLMGYDRFLLGFYRYPEKIRKLCRIVTDAAIDFVKAQEEIVGKACKLFISDHSPTFMSRKHFIEFALPELQRITKTFSNALIIYHNEGDVNHLLDLIPEMGVDIFHFGSPINVLEAKRRIGDKVCLMGNVASRDVMLEGTPQMVEETCKNVILDGAPEGGFILSVSGGLLPHTPPENVDAMITSAEKYGVYPIER
ncbi:uroporphyrinogen decarboxylase family protein [Candidatus Bathyarchaeota archaeon]|nr:uroporphyrinogen decarboxylase family protein [Candidatus Bathyarchaeota archaeon]